MDELVTLSGLEGSNFSVVTKIFGFIRVYHHTVFLSYSIFIYFSIYVTVQVSTPRLHTNWVDSVYYSQLVISTITFTPQSTQERPWT